MLPSSALRWGKEWVYGNRYNIIDHIADQSGKEGTRSLQARVSISLDQPDFKFIIDHEVQTEQLVTEHLAFLINCHISNSK